MQKILLFCIFNVFLNGVDVGTDLSTVLTLWNHPFWASLTLTWMLTPFLIHSVGFFANLIWNKFERPVKGYAREYFSVAGVHFPFFLPLVNIWRAKRLYGLQFGMTSFEDENYAAVEEILNDAAEASFAESFYEAGPQSVTQVFYSFFF